MSTQRKIVVLSGSKRTGALVSMITRKVVLLTGGSRGIGRATALLLAEHGAKVVITARDHSALEAVADEIRAKQGQCLALAMDLTDPESIKHAIRQTTLHFEHIDVLINNAGVMHFGPVASTPPQTWAHVISTNLTGPFLCIREVLPLMKTRGHGYIINVASHAGFYGFPYLGAYCASKFGLIGLSQSLGRELLGEGIRVSYVCPGAVNTEMLRAFPDDVAGTMKKDTPERVARCINELVTDHDTGRRRHRLLDKIFRHINRRLGMSQIEVWNSWK